MRKFTLALTLGLAGCSSQPTNDAQQRAALHMQIGNGFLAKGQYPQAMAELSAAEQLNPKDPQIVNNLGLAYYVRGKNEIAERKFRRTLELAPDFSEAKANLARVMIDDGRWKAAIKLLREVEGDLTYANQDKTFAELGMAYFAGGQFKQAEEYLLRALAIHRDNCAAANFYGRTLQELKRWPQSAQALDQAVEFCRQSKFEEPLYYSAVSFYSIGDQEKSKARLDELIREYPQSKYVPKAKGMLGLLEP